MDEFLKMDVFFVVSTIAVVVVAGLLSYAIYRAIRILHTLERISHTVSDEADLIRSDIQEARLAARAEGYRFLGLARGVRRLAQRLLMRK